jgi:hypothetical protein
MAKLLFPSCENTDGLKDVLDFKLDNLSGGLKRLESPFIFFYILKLLFYSLSKFTIRGGELNMLRDVNPLFTGLYGG